MSPLSAVRPRSTRTRAARRQPRTRPVVEALEARNLLTTFGPAQLAHAYGFDQINFAGTPGDGRGQTIAIVDSFDHPNIAADLQTFTNQYSAYFQGKPAGNFKKVNQAGSDQGPFPTANTNWDL